MRQLWKRIKRTRDFVEFLLGLANLFTLTVMTPIMLIAFAVTLASEKPISAGPEHTNVLSQIGVTLCVVGIVPSIALICLVAWMVNSYQGSEGWPYRTPTMTDQVSERPATVAFTLHLPRTPMPISILLSCWWGLAGLGLTAIAMTRHGLILTPPTVGHTGWTDPITYGIFWVVGSCFVLSLSSAIYLALAVYAATRSEQMVNRFWRLRYWYCLVMTLVNYGLVVIRWAR